MRTNPERPPLLPPLPSPLAGAAVPDGCRVWSREQARAWADSLPPVWVPVRTRARLGLAWAVLAGCAALLLVMRAGTPPVLAVLLPLQVVWTLKRPEAVLASAPVVLVALAVLALREPGLPWPATTALASALVVSSAIATLRLHARKRQRGRALAAAEGVTARVPDTGEPVRRGKFLMGFAPVPTSLGAALMATAHLWDQADDRQAALTAGSFAVGLGLTVLASGVLARHRAVALRRAPAPVLRVLVREGTAGDTEVFAADDVGALRPLFSVPLRERDAAHADHQHDDEDLDRLLDGLDDDSPGPLREAVLYGTPCDDAELLLVSAAEEPEAPHLVEWSTGPVRPISERAARRRLAREKRASARTAVREELRGTAVRPADGAVRRWSAGWQQRLTAAVLVLWGSANFWGETGLVRHYLLGAAIGLAGSRMLPGMIAWRITADSSGLWFNGLRRTRHIAWDHIRVVRCKGTQLEVDSRRATFGAEWSVSAPRWPWLERRLGLLHPHERTAAEITAMWQDPALRPVAESTERERGRPQWPLAAALAIAWCALLVLGR